jgi:hypothetical protein
MSLGGVEFAVFSGPMDADFEARLNGSTFGGAISIFSLAPPRSLLMYSLIDKFTI